MSIMVTTPIFIYTETVKSAEFRNKFNATHITGNPLIHMENELGYRMTEDKRLCLLILHVLRGKFTKKCFP